MLGKIKAFFGTRKEKKDGPHSIDTGRISGPVPRTPLDQPASLELDRAAAGSSIVIPPPNPRPPDIDPVSGALPCPPGDFGHIVGEGTTMDVALIRSVDTQDRSSNDHRSASRSPSHGIQLIVANSHSIEQATFQQGTFANAQSVQIGTAYMNDYGQSEHEKRAEQERREREELRAEEERKAREERRLEREKRVKEERAKREKLDKEERAKREIRDKEERTEKEKRAKEEREAEERKQEKDALEKLTAKSMSGAMLDSKDRGYVPRCNEDTRTALRRRVIWWSRNGAEVRRLLWLSGPAGVGKSAVAQTVAEAFKEAGLLGAAFFFSRPNNRLDPDVLIPTLVYQLASLLPEYRRVISQLLTRDPFILNKNRRSQFRELIINPFLSLTAQLPSITQKPVFIVLDGLDECNGREAQREFVEMISHHTHKEGPALRLRWMVCSRPEPHLKVAFSTAECKTICLEEKLEVDDTEAQRDARRILATGFTEIRKRYPDQLEEDWPAEDQVHFIAERASGHLGFVSFILRFIGDEHYDNPSGQLEVCLKFLECTGGSTDFNPLHPLDLLYTQILSDIPTNVLPITQRVLGLFIFYGNTHLTAAVHANFLCLDRATFYSSLQRLHSVLSIPSASEAHSEPIQVYHASFSDFLKDRTRAGKFFLEEGMDHLEVAISGLKWLDHSRKATSNQVGMELAWIPPETSRKTLLASLCKFSFTPCWMACLKVPEESRATLFKSLENFDFRLDYRRWWKDEALHFVHFIRWLATLDDQHNTLIEAGPSYTTVFTTICCHEGDPNYFFQPFPRYFPRSRSDAGCTMYLDLGKNNPASFWLSVSEGSTNVFL